MSSPLGHEVLTPPENWGGVTDPTLHDASNFRYLVHGLNPAGGMSALMSQKMDAENGITGDEGWGDQRINLYDEPERLGERIALSMSLIDQKHTDTWGEGGLVVGAAPENIVVTSPADNGTNNNNLDQVLAQAARQPQLTGDSLLAQTSPRDYNEVVAVCKQGAHPLDLKGFFIKTTPSGEPLNRQLADEMANHARRLGMPLVRIASEAFHTSDRVDIKEDGKLAVEFNGHRYLLRGYGDSEFDAYDGQIRPRFPAPHEVEAAVSYSVSTGELETTKGADILKSYAARDAQRQMPTVRFNDDGGVRSISYRTGYGTNEDEVILDGNGTGSRINRAEQVAFMKNIGMSQSSRIVSRLKDKPAPITPPEADSMVERACAALDETEVNKVREWFTQNRGNLVRQWEFHEQARRRLGGFGVFSFAYGDKLQSLGDEFPALYKTLR